jgi:hypothetical protein
LSISLVHDLAEWPDKELDSNRDAAQQSLAADGAIACFSSNFFPSA